MGRPGAPAAVRNMREAGQTLADRVRADRRLQWGIGLAVLLLFVLLPYAFQPASKTIDHWVTALALVVMALGLNIVVGFAGLLDLGYVAFYAIGAYTAGWFASDFYAAVNGGKGIHI